MRRQRFLRVGPREARPAGRGLVLCACVLVACGGRTPGGTPDGRVPDGHVVDGGDPDAGPYCPLDPVGTADASGQTPGGPFHATLGWFGIYGGECGGFRAVLVPDRASFEAVLDQAPFPMELAPPAEALVLFPQNYDFEHGGWINSGPVDVYYYQNRAVLEATGTITITRADDRSYPFDAEHPPFFEATFRVESPGWSVAGRVQAGYCEHLSVYCP